MHPILLQIGSFTLYSYGVMVAMGTAVCMFYGLHLVYKDGLDPDKCTNVGVVTMLSGLLGCRLAFYIIEWEKLQYQPWYEFFFLWQGGLVFYGGIAVGLPVAIVMIRLYKLPMLKLMDIGGVIAPLGQAIGRIGCFMAGCCYGAPWESGVCAVTFTDPHSLAPRGVPLHPTQLYTSGALLLIFLIMLVIRKRRRFYGQVFFTYTLLHGIARMIIEQFRADFRGEPLFGDVAPTAVFAGCLALGSAVVLFILWRRSLKQGSLT